MLALTLPEGQVDVEAACTPNDGELGFRVLGF
jgi:hypothetical protein